MTRYEDQTPAQRHAIAVAAEERRAELEPLRLAIDDEICRLGWKRAKPIVTAHVKGLVKSQRGSWWAGVGKRNGPKLLEALQAARETGSEGQLRLW